MLIPEVVWHRCEEFVIETWLLRDFDRMTQFWTLGIYSCHLGRFSAITALRLVFYTTDRAIYKFSSIVLYSMVLGLPRHRPVVLSIHCVLLNCRRTGWAGLLLNQSTLPKFQIITSSSKSRWVNYLAGGNWNSSCAVLGTGLLLTY